MKEHLYVVTYDISDQKRWRQVFKTMNGYGEWLQLSVFQCRISRRRFAELRSKLDRAIHHGEDQVVFLDLGDAESVAPGVVSLGRDYAPIVKRQKWYSIVPVFAG